MGYYFECPTCNRREPVTFEEFDTLEETCDDCGEDGCIFCMKGGICEACWNVVDDEVDNPDWGV